MAGSDTSQASSNSGLTYVSEDTKLQEKIIKELQKIENDNVSSYQAIIQSNEMEKLSLEMLRLCNPVSIIIPRVILNDMTFDGISVKKGDLLSVTIGSSFRREDWFNEANKFDVNRHQVEEAQSKDELLRMKKQTNDMAIKFIPFSYGKRMCPGRIMGEIMIKVLIAELIKKFEITKPTGFEKKFSSDGVFTVEKCKLNLRLR